MRDISAKQISLRTARAVGLVRCSPATLALVQSGSLPKGNLLDVARAAGLLAAKNTHTLIPHCHPVSIDGLDISFAYLTETHVPAELAALAGQSGVAVYAEGKSIGRTGIEMEVLTAVSVAALTIYDLLKPLGDEEISIESIKLLRKTGGKSDRNQLVPAGRTAAVLVCSDAAAAGRREDKSGLKIKDLLAGFGVETVEYRLVPDEAAAITDVLRGWVAADIPFIFTTGGTGLSPRDGTVEAVRTVLDREVPGITEAMRVHGQVRTSTAMLSRAVAGTAGRTLIVTLPGSVKGVQESLEAILPQVFHARPMLEGEGH